MRRMWINQPSTLQPDHALHGTKVLAEKSDFGDHMRRIWFTSGDVISREISVLSLSDGWQEKQQREQRTIARNWQVQIDDLDGETQLYTFVAFSAWQIAEHIASTMRSKGDFYGHDSSQTMNLSIIELVADADVSEAIDLSKKER